MTRNNDDSACRACRKCGSTLILGENWVASLARSKNYICNDCRREYRAANSTRISENNRALYDRKREAVKLNVKEYRKANRAAILERNARYYETNRQSILDGHRDYYKANADRIRENVRQYRKNNPAAINAHSHARKARELNAMLPDSDRKAMMVFFDLAQRMTRITGAPYEVDHIIPLTRGGAHHQDNLQVMRKDWNRAKRNRLGFPSIGPGKYVAPR